MPDHSDCKACTANARTDDPYLVWRNDLWVLRHTRPPYAALSWMTLHSERHAESLTALSAAELVDLGPTLARISTAIIGATGALRVYLASMTEMTPHFHAHLVPRYNGGPKGWETFKLKQQSASSTVTDESVHAVMTAIRAALN